MVYYPDNKACLGDLDVDTLDAFYLRNYHKKLGYDKIKQYWWHVPGKGLENGLRSLNNDKEIREMVKCAKINNGVIDVYLEHGVSLPKVLEGKDSIFKPNLDEDSSSESDTGMKNINSGSRSRVKNVGPLAKGKEKILVEDDAFVQEVSDEEGDLIFIGSFAEGVVYGLDPGANSNGANSWHSDEMKTPPNSEDELEEDNDSNDACLVFREGARLNDLHLEVGIKFETKWDFSKDVKEYKIQEGRRIRLAKNDCIRCKAVCKVKECPWVVYASRDHEDTCWQIKTFNDDNTCPREDRNRAANRKKVRKYPNFRHCKATTYFKTRFDLTLNKSSISRALMDARSVVYGDGQESLGARRKPLSKLPTQVSNSNSKLPTQVANSNTNS
ncbi:hypothetical protein Ahy_A07g035721 [Arachis hypogaea]|uniref:4Fe-4S ferredoxin-type domain-containing protein n=1 Tax=Arachis hypogaea TaxID=3818 RepID=A0A445CED0_ARAHY|nr:hypothetical protein Ahy_A07g035721 [Arachis hypogaea]